MVVTSPGRLLEKSFNFSPIHIQYSVPVVRYSTPYLRIVEGFGSRFPFPPAIIPITSSSACFSKSGPLCSPDPSFRSCSCMGQKDPLTAWVSQSLCSAVAVAVAATCNPYPSNSIPHQFNINSSTCQTTRRPASWPLHTHSRSSRRTCRSAHVHRIRAHSPRRA